MQNPKSILLRTHNVVIVYTAFRILLVMKKKLGLEAMLEYHHKYLQTIEGGNPLLKHAVSRALSLIDIEKIYREVSCDEK